MSNPSTKSGYQDIAGAERGESEWETSGSGVVGGQESEERMSSGEGRESGRSMRGEGVGARCGESADTACRCCVTDALQKLWARSSYGGRGMASPSSSGTVGRAEMAFSLRFVA